MATWATRRFEWEEAKFQLKTPLRELCESISTVRAAAAHVVGWVGGLRGGGGRGVGQGRRAKARPGRESAESAAPHSWQRLGGLDEELKTKLAEYNGVKGALQQSERKAQGNLMVRGLTEIVKEEDMRGTVGSDYVSTLLLVVPKHRRLPTCMHPSAHPLHTLCALSALCTPSAPLRPALPPALPLCALLCTPLHTLRAPSAARRTS